MRVRVGSAVAATLGVLALIAPAALSEKRKPAKPAPCTGGRYVITGNPRVTGKPTLKSGSIMLRGSTVSLSAGCTETVVRTKRMRGGMKGMKGGTRIRATWAQCAGVRGKVRLKAGIDSTCRRMWGAITTRRGKSRFDAELSNCGNGALDAGEECDGAACTDGSACTESCLCDRDGIPGPGCTPGVDGCPIGGGGTTTTLSGGPGVTTTSLANGATTTTTIGNGGVTTTTLPGPMPSDHYKCYKLRQGRNRFHPGPVSLIDRFGAIANVVEEPERLCNPVDKNGEGIDDPTAHLMCYDLAPQRGFQGREVVVRNQFGDQLLTVVRAESLCVPAEKDGVQSALNLNHFKCYRVSQRRGKFAQRTVTLADQFESKTTIVQRPVSLCTPVDKNGEGVVDAQKHLTCYRIVDVAGQPEFAQRFVSVEDQFSAQQVQAFRGTCRKASLLCVPSITDPGANTTTSTLAPAPTTSSTVGTSTTSTSSTSSSSLPAQTSTTVAGTTTSSSSTPVPTTTSTSTAVPTTAPTVPTTSSSIATPTTSSSTSTSSTTSTTAGVLCCNGAQAVSFLTANQPGDCGDVLRNNGNKAFDVQCAGLYTGGGGNSVPLPFAVPDMGFAINTITQCTGQTATLGGTTSAQTGSNRNCTSPGCLFGAPLAVPNPNTPPTSVCVLNLVQTAANGMLDCSTGATTVSLPLQSIIHLTGDTATDPMDVIAGVQPCPLCSNNTCIGGPNNGMSCAPGTSVTGLGAGYPTSHDCPPDPMFNIGTLPIAFSLTTGTITWSATEATNPTSGVQTRIFSGFCRDFDESGAFQQPARQCWENGMAVGGPCTQPFETCHQRTQGAFGPNGGNFRTITAIGSAASLLGGSGPGTLVSIFTVPPTFDATVDAAGDLPGPGAVALPGTATLCPNAMSCAP
jgi:hypothetical protein